MNKETRKNIAEFCGVLSLSILVGGFCGYMVDRVLEKISALENDDDEEDESPGYLCSNCASISFLDKPPPYSP